MAAPPEALHGSGFSYSTAWEATPTAAQPRAAGARIFVRIGVRRAGAAAAAVSVATGSAVFSAHGNECQVEGPIHRYLGCGATR
jgi:hypothetical protein